MKQTNKTKHRLEIAELLKTYLQNTATDKPLNSVPTRAISSSTNPTRLKSRLDTPTVGSLMVSPDTGGVDWADPGTLANASTATVT
ncbi:hypothetical protein ElyMa_005638400 [Elysia marginata]|uniref:Uncharacterized protein n=1 Tax=Elysia marginata TaxID=1093978 RepID=A0AAV4F9P9_9GAST|nr:hypothetical protein ElyMa_005638400 [Elysia marginata]